jgi:hypothetical protein
MATGRLAASNLSAATTTTIYTTPASTYTVASVSICNRGTATTQVSIAIADADSPALGEYIEFQTELLAKNILERTGMVLAAGQKIVVLSSQASVSAVAVGIETPA